MGNCLVVSGEAPRSPKTVRRSSTGASKNNRNEVRSGRDGGNSANKMSILRKMDVDFPNGKILNTSHLIKFTYSQLRSATSDFPRDAIIGEGGFGTVFKGWLDEKTLAPANPGSGMVTAIKKLNPGSWRMQGIQVWQSEIKFLGSLSHPNLVKLLGYCLDEKEVLLVYEFMAAGSLEQHLFKKGSQPLSWSTRLKILIGAARGLAFLHTSDKQVIFHDFEASNILLDSNYHAKLSDFVLAKNGPLFGDSHVSTRVMGTYGYAAPSESVATGRGRGTYGYPAPKDVATGDLYGKSDDVYGFGRVLLEMLTGLRAKRSPFLSDLFDKLLDPGFASYGDAAPKHVATAFQIKESFGHEEINKLLQEMLRALDTGRPNGPQNQIESTRPLLSDRLEGFMDKRLEGQYPPEAALKAAQLSLKCLNNDPRSRRPSMKEVVDALEQIEAFKQKRRAAAPPANQTAAPPAKPRAAKRKTIALPAKPRAAKPKTTAPPAKPRAAKPKTTALPASQTATPPAQLRAAKQYLNRERKINITNNV